MSTAKKDDVSIINHESQSKQVEDGKRHASYNICSVEQKRGMATAEAESSPAQSSPSVSKDVLKVEKKLEITDEEAFDVPSDENANTVELEAADLPQHFSNTNLNVGAFSTADTATEREKTSIESRRLVSEEHSSASGSTESQGCVEKPLLSEVTDVDGIGEEEQIHALQVEYESGKAAAQSDISSSSKRSEHLELRRPQAVQAEATTICCATPQIKTSGALESDGALETMESPKEPAMEWLSVQELSSPNFILTTDHLPAAVRQEKIQSTSITQESIDNLQIAQELPLVPEDVSTLTQQPVYLHQQQASEVTAERQNERIQENTEISHFPLANNNYCKEIFDELLLIFPNIDKTILATFCPSKWSSEISHDDQLSHIVHQLLQYGRERQLEANVADKVSTEASQVEAQEGTEESFSLLNDNRCQGIYNELIRIFPTIDRDVLKEFCLFRCSSDVSPNEQLSDIVDQVLRYENERELDVKMYSSIDQAYKHLLEMFPDADPTYLHNMAEDTYADEEGLEKFIVTALANQNYPTRDEYLSKMKNTEEQLRYTKNFTVAEFLKIIPDPFEHFMNNRRRCKHSPSALEFLNNFFNTHRADTISRVYEIANYNLSIAADMLCRTLPDLGSTRSSTEVPITTINILEEVAFIRHQKEIKQYMDDVKAAEAVEFEQLKRANNLLECQCCYDNECIPSKCSNCDAGHIFCHSCIINGTDSKLGENETRVPCFLDCGSEFSLSTLEKILTPNKFNILVAKRQAAEVAAAGLEGLVACPFCHFALIPPEDDKIFKCLNPKCMKESCILCKEPNHVPLRCNEVSKAEKARKYMEEKMTGALVRKCYRCRRAYIKEEGCNLITCLCGATMCYVCGKEIRDGSHFRNRSGNGSIQCPHYQNDARVHVETVRRAALEAQEELLREDPTLYIDAIGLLPELPPTTTGEY